MLDLKQAESFKSALQPYLVPDANGDCNGRYTLVSLYYDSPEFRCYWEKMDDTRIRRKLRTRLYDSGEVVTDETLVFLEVKQRVDRVTQKRRAVLPYRDALRLCNDREMPDCTQEDKAVMDEIYVFLWQYNLYPAIMVRYDRQAFLGTHYDCGLRVTFDTSLTFQSHPLHLHEQASSLPLMAADQVVMEIKVNERVPYWLAGLTAQYNLKMTGFSKYCRSIEAAQILPGFLPGCFSTESSQDALSSAYSVFRNLERRIPIGREQDCDV